MLLLPKFTYHEPKCLEDACQLMAEFGDRGAVLAGGTDLLVNMKEKRESPGELVSIGKIEELSRLEFFDDKVEIGACCTVARLQCEKIDREFHALKQGADNLGSPLVRNLATVGGNVASSRPAADLAPPLIIHGAKVVLRGLSGERNISLDEFFLSPGENVMESGEILAKISIDKASVRSGSGYIKLALRKSLEISLVNVGSFIALDDTGVIESARVALGSVAPKPIRSSLAEKVLVGNKPCDELFVKAAEAARKESEPIDNFRGSAEYRRDMVKTLVHRTLNTALARALGELR